MQCRRFFQLLRCIRSLRLCTKRYQCLQCGSVLSVALLNRSLRFVYVSVCDTPSVTQCRRIFFFSSVSLLFIYSNCSACSTLPQANRPLLVTRQIHTRHYWSGCLPIGHTWWLNYGRDRRHTSRPTNSPASTLHHWRFFQLRRPV